MMKTWSVQFSSVTQSIPTPWVPMDCSMPGFPVHHQSSELAQTHVRWVGDAIQPSHPLSSASPPAFKGSTPCQKTRFYMSQLRPGADRFIDWFKNPVLKLEFVRADESPELTPYSLLAGKPGGLGSGRAELGISPYPPSLDFSSVRLGYWCRKLSFSVHRCWIKSWRQNFGQSRKG